MKNNNSFKSPRKYNCYSFHSQESGKKFNILKSGIKELDKIIWELKPGEIIFIDGNNKIILDIEKRICVNFYKSYKRNVIYIDGGMGFNPYRIARYAKESEIDYREILNHIHVSRVFTLFQLNTILQDKLEQIMLEYNPQICIIGKFLTPYMDSEVSSDQVNIIMKNNLSRVKEIAKKYGIVALLLNFDSRINEFGGLNKILYRSVDEIVTIKRIGKTINFSLLKKNPIKVFSLIEKGQLSLNDFN